MKNFAGHEIKKKLTLRGLIFLSFSTILVVFFTVDGGNGYKANIEKGDIFTKTEKIKVSNFQNYPQYGTYGISIKLVPGKNFALFSSSGAVNEMIFRGDSGERLKLFSGKKGANLFQEKVNIDFSVMVFYICSFLAIYLGYNALKDSDYLKFLSSLYGKKQVFVKAIVRTVLYVNICYFFFLVISYCILYLMRVSLDLSSIPYYVVASVLTFTILAVLGAFIGRLKPSNRFTAIFVTIAIIVLIPFAIKKIVDIDAKNLLSNEILEQANVKTIMRVEKKYKDNFEPYNDGKVPRIKLLKFINDNLEQEHKEIATREKMMSDEMQNKIKNLHRLSSLFPITFYNIICAEQSGFGYLNVIDFYNHVRRKKTGFILHYAQKRFFQPESPVEPYLKDHEYVFWGRPNFPHGFVSGVIISVVYLFIAILFAYNRFNKLFKGTSEECAAAEDVSLSQPLRIPQGKVEYFRTKSPMIGEYMYQVFCGNCKADSLVTHDESNFIYLPDPASLPIDKKILARFAGLPSSYLEKEKWEILLRLAASTGKIIYVDGWFDDLKPGQMEIAMELISRQNLRVFCLGRESDFEFAEKIIFSVKDDSIDAGKYYEMIISNGKPNPKKSEINPR